MYGLEKYYQKSYVNRNTRHLLVVAYTQSENNIRVTRNSPLFFFTVQNV